MVSESLATIISHHPKFAAAGGELDANVLVKQVVQERDASPTHVPHHMLLGFQLLSHHLQLLHRDIQFLARQQLGIVGEKVKILEFGSGRGLIARFIGGRDLLSKVGALENRESSHAACGGGLLLVSAAEESKFKEARALTWFLVPLWHAALNPVFPTFREPRMRQLFLQDICVLHCRRERRDLIQQSTPAIFQFCELALEFLVHGRLFGDIVSGLHRDFRLHCSFFLVQIRQL